VLSDHEQRALEELERRYEDEAPQPIPSRPASRPPGRYALAVLGGISAVLLVLGAAVAALALATAGAIGWLSWCLWTHGAHGVDAAARRPGESVRRYLRWLSEAE
jgi:hypothetical protein